MQINIISSELINFGSMCAEIFTHLLAFSMAIRSLVLCKELALFDFHAWGHDTLVK